MRKEFQKKKPASPLDHIPRESRIVVGHHAITEVMKVRPRSVKMAWLDQNWRSSQNLRELEEQLRQHKIKMEPQAAALLERVSKTHQGAALFVSEEPELDLGALKNKEQATILLLDGVEDPHNLGAILRTAWLFKVDAILIPEHRASPLTATACKIASGGAEHVPVVSFGNFSQILEQLKEIGFWVFGFSHEAKKSIYQLKAPEKIVLAMGAEDKGLRTTTERLCDELLYIPQSSASASYNVSVAAGIAMSECSRQRLS